MSIQLLKKYSTIILWLTALTMISSVLLTYEYHWLWKIQELNLFLWTPLFFQQQMEVASGMLIWLSTFFTQFLYQPLLGVFMLCAWWWLLMWILNRSFRIPTRWSSVLLIPIALLLVANVDMAYWIYLQKLRGWFFAATIGTTVVAILLWVFRSLPKHFGVRQSFLIFATVVGYPLFGFYALSAVFLMGLWAWWLEKHSLAAVDSILAILCVVGVPLIFYHYVYYQTNIINIYWVGLPIFRIFDNYLIYYIPYGLLGAFFVGLVVTYREHRNEQPTHQYWPIVVQTILMIALVIGVASFWYKDENYHHELAMQHYVEETRWNKVLEEAAQQKEEPTRVIVMLRNLALSRLGRQGDEMYRYRGDSKIANSIIPVQSSMLVGSMIYYNYGMLNDCHHLCIEGGVEYGWRINHLLYMARSSMLNGDIKAMHKFTGLLKHTLYYKKWAELLEGLQCNPKRMAEASETAPILHMLNYEDMIGTDNGYTETYLMGILSKMDSDDPYMQEQCLLATLWAKEGNLFWPRFIKYLQQHPQGPIPRHYQEAAYLFAHQGHPEALNLPYSEGIKETYQRFTKLASQYNGKDLKEVQKALFPLFGDTFYYDYYMMKELVYF